MDLSSSYNSSYNNSDRLVSSDFPAIYNITFFSLEVTDVLLKENDDVKKVLVTNNSKETLESDITNVILPVIYIMIFIVGFPANALAMWVFLLRTKVKHPQSILMASLALTDLLFIIWLPLKIFYHLNGNNWIFGEVLCKLLVGSFYGNMYCSTVLIACISVQRYWAVVHPFSYKFNKRVTGCLSVCVCVIVWLLTIPLYTYDQTIKVINLNITTCHDVTHPNQFHFHAGYFLTLGTVGFVVPCVVCVVAYVLMFRSLVSSMDISSNGKKKKAVKLMITVLVMFMVSFTPSNIILIVHYAQLAAGIQNSAYGHYIIALCLSSLNSCIDPFVYYFISEEFRKQVKNMLMCRATRSPIPTPKTSDTS
ncbi:proteinase-activated receptor 2-like [Pangasianodon hypophthalmus]|uniref:proteinase-activated receptor 2-like n=1 Tax=Pangasianodon hypophthalmus TaxID=310915 RepID=UPI00147EDF4F|nr:proteinase-activated receptor 2-like [Pangasianodon hypophthalmus]